MCHLPIQGRPLQSLLFCKDFKGELKYIYEVIIRFGQNPIQLFEENKKKSAKMFMLMGICHLHLPI